MTQKERLVELLNVDMSGCEGDYAEEMAEYLLSQGVIAPPCKIGETIYLFDVDEKKIMPAKVYEVDFDEKGMFVRAAYGDRRALFHADAFGKSAFLSTFLTGTKKESTAYCFFRDSKKDLSKQIDN